MPTGRVCELICLQRAIPQNNIAIYLEILRKLCYTIAIDFKTDYTLEYKSMAVGNLIKITCVGN